MKVMLQMSQKKEVLTCKYKCLQNHFVNNKQWTPYSNEISVETV